MSLPDHIKQQGRGASAALARALGVTPVMVHQWVHGIKPIPPRRAIAIERATDGAVTVESMCPDSPWVRVRDRLWPNAAGRPCLDTARAEA